MKVLRAPVYAFCVLFAVLTIAKPSAQEPDTLGFGYVQQQLAEMDLLETMDLDSSKWMSPVPGVRVANTTSAEFEESSAALRISLGARALGQRRVPILLRDPVAVPGIAKTFELGIQSAADAHVTVRLILADSRGLEYKFPLSDRPLPGARFFGVSIPPSLVQRSPRLEAEGLTLRGLEVLPVDGVSGPIDLVLGFLNVVTDIFETDVRDSDRPEEW